MSMPDLLKQETYRESDELKILAGKLVHQTVNRTLADTVKIQRTVIYVLLAISIVFAGWVVYQSNKSIMVPYLIVKDTSGKVDYIGVIKQQGTPVDDALKMHFIERFIEDARTIPDDPVMAKTMWKRASAMLTPAARKIFSYEFEKNKMSDRLGFETVQITILSNVAQSADTYSVAWQEEVFENGTPKGKYKMVGSFTIETGTIKNEAAARNNPMGIFFRHFSWAKELR